MPNRETRKAVLVFSMVHGLLLLCVAMAEDKSAKPSSDKVEKIVPFEMLPSNHMVVTAKINGKGPYRLIFDLGAPVTLLNGQASEETGVVDKKAPSMFLFSARGEGKIDTLEMGDLSAKNIPVVVMDHPALRALRGFLGRPLHGIMGFTFFARYKTTIDYQAKVMKLTPADYQARDLMKELPDRLAGPKVARERMLSSKGLWGMTLVDPTDGVNSRGASIAKVYRGSAADSAGLKPGDVCVSIDGRWTVSAADALDAAEEVPPGALAEIVVLRDGREQAFKVAPRPGL